MLKIIGAEHDWAFLLGETGLLARDQNIGAMVHFFGVLIFGFAMIWSVRHGWFGPTTEPDESDTASEEH